MPKILPHIATSPTMFKIIIYGFVLLGLIIETYIAAYVLNAGRSSTFGDDQPPGLPDLNEITDQVLMPAVLLFGTAILCSLPFAIYAITATAGGNAILEIFKSGFWGIVAAMHLAVLATPSDVVGWILYIVGGVYYPMALMCVMVTGSPRGLDPRIVLRAIVQVAKVYPIVLLIVHLKGYLWFEVVFKQLSSQMTFGTSIFLPLVLLVASAIYLLVFQSRVLGMMYWCHRQELAFIEEE